MFELMVEDHFDSAHFLKGYVGECQNMHGHCFKVQLIIKGNTLNEVGLLVDYKWLKSKLKEVLKALDHKILNNVLSFNPTSELLAKYIYEELNKKFESNARLTKVIVWESEKSAATYYQAALKDCC